VFERYVAIAVIVAPTWVAGIHRVRPAVYLPLNLLGASVWAAGIGFGAYFAGPPIEEAVSDLGWVITAALVLLVLAGISLEVRRRRLRRVDTQRRAAESEERIVPPEGG
jgi:membrane protein DedA with SNARE-associated domain